MPGLEEGAPAMGQGRRGGLRWCIAVGLAGVASLAAAAMLLRVAIRGRLHRSRPQPPSPPEKPEQHTPAVPSENPTGGLEAAGYAPELPVVSSWTCTESR